MAFKINISNKDGKTYKIESDSDFFVDKTLGEVIKGDEFSDDLKGYEFKIAGTSDKSGFTSLPDVSGSGLKKVLLSYGKGMKQTRPKGLRRRKTVRGVVISRDITQINLVAVKEGGKKLHELFADQNQLRVKENHIVRRKKAKAAKKQDSEKPTAE
jgi:small subunit ribosomal protein S6e